MASVVSVIPQVPGAHLSSPPQCLKRLESLLYILLTGAQQFDCCLLVGTFLFPSFLLGFLSCVGSSLLLVCLGMQVNPQNKGVAEASPRASEASLSFSLPAPSRTSSS